MRVSGIAGSSWITPKRPRRNTPGCTNTSKHLKSLQLLKSLRGELLQKSLEQWRQRLEEEHQRSLEILGE